MSSELDIDTMHGRVAKSGDNERPDATVTTAPTGPGMTKTDAPHCQILDGLVVRPATGLLEADRVTRFVGISAESVGSRSLAMGLAIIPPGAIAPPHLHEHHETGIYLLAGRVELRWGEALAHLTVCEAGDFVLTPAGQPHQPRNLSDTEPAVVIFARTDPREHEDTTPYAPEYGALTQPGPCQGCTGALSP